MHTESREQFLDAQEITMRETPEKKRIVLLHSHIFKNGGTTIDGILKNNFGPNALSLESPDGNFISPKKIEEIVRNDLTAKSISSHKLPVLSTKNNDTVFIPLVMIREPLDRTKSMYLFYRRQEQAISHECLLAQRTTFTEFVSALMETRLDGSFSNLQCKFFLGNQTNPSSDNWPLIAYKIQATQCLGVVDLFKESITKWGNYLKGFIPSLDLAFERQNVTPNRPSKLEYRLEEIKKELGKTIVDIFVQRNKFDYKLYKYAKEILCNAKTFHQGNNQRIERPTALKVQGKSKKVKITASKLEAPVTGQPLTIIWPKQEVVVAIHIESYAAITEPIIGLSVKNNRQVVIFEMNNLQAEITIPSTKAGQKNIYKFMFHMPPLNVGTYTISTAFAEGSLQTHNILCERRDAIIFLVSNSRDVQSSGILFVQHYSIICTSPK